MGANIVRPSAEHAQAMPATSVVAAAPTRAAPGETDLEFGQNNDPGLRAQMQRGTDAEAQVAERDDDEDRREEQAPQATLSRRVGENYEAMFFRYAEDLNAPKRNLFQLCLRPEGVLAMQLLTAAGATAGAALVMLEFSLGYIGVEVLVGLVLLLIWLDVARTAVLVGIRQKLLRPSIRAMQSMRATLYLSGGVSAILFLAFVIGMLRRSDGYVLLLFILLELLYVVCFGWLHALVDFCTPSCLASCRAYFGVQAVMRALADAAKSGNDPVTPEEIEEAAPLICYNAARFAEDGLRCDEDCAVCLIDFEDGDNVRVLRCEHIFHDSCVDSWFKTDHDTCPTCRSPLRARDAKRDEAAATIESGGSQAAVAEQDDEGDQEQ